MDQDHKGSMILQEQLFAQEALYSSDIVNVQEPNETVERSSLLISEVGDDEVQIHYKSQYAPKIRAQTSTG